MRPVAVAVRVRRAIRILLWDRGGGGFGVLELGEVVDRES